MNYDEIGLKAGLEIHQQINTHKLFCSCSSEIIDTNPDAVVTRRLRVSAGETGQVDTAAIEEVKKSKFFVYNSHRQSSCLVELDEEPIHNINLEALDVALQIALLTNAMPVDRIQVMRKTVVDGSNTSGFQRTALVAMNGTVETTDGLVTIPTICLEEDSAKIVQRHPDFNIYNLSRLGIPLIEISTGPDLKNPQQVKEVAEHIGMILRSTGKVKRGLGTIRQDVNVSIKGGARIEIKGAQDLRSLSRIVSLEAERQKNLLEIAKQLKGTVERKIVDCTDIFTKSESKVATGTVLGFRLVGFKGFLGKQIQPGRRLGSELSDYAKIVAGVTGIIHSDELPKYGITQTEVDAVSKKLNLGKNDAFVIVSAEKQKAIKALQAAMNRAETAMRGVASEVRKAQGDATTTYLRPMPGAARMYPETDTMPVAPDISKVEKPELRSSKIERYVKLGLGKDLATKLVKEDKDSLFDEINEINKNVGPAYIAEILVSYGTELKKINIGEMLDERHLKLVFAALNNGEIAKESVKEIIAQTSKSGKLDIDKFKVLTDAQLEKEIKNIISKNKNLPLNALIGNAMGRLRGKADGKKIVELVKKHLNS